MNNADLDKCRKDCKFYENAVVFELCKHEDSQYSVADKEDFHSIGHMWAVSSCGPDARCYRRAL